MKKTILFILAVLSATTLFAEKLAVFDRLIRPAGFYMNNGYLFIVQFPHIYMHSLKDFRLIKRVGKKGEGPQEFLRYARLYFQPDTIIVHSENRFSYFTKDLKYIKEERVPVQFSRGVSLMGDQLVVSHTVPGKNKNEETDLTVNIYDWSFKKVKEIYRQKYYFQMNRDINAIYLPEVDRRSGIRFAVRGDRIFIEGEDGETGNIYVFNKKGEKIYTIKHEFEKLEVTDEHIQAVVAWHKLKKRRLYDILKRRNQLYTPDYFAAIRFMGVTDDKIYIIPYKKKAGKNRFFIFDLEGKLLKEVDAPIEEKSLFSFFPAAIFFFFKKTPFKINTGLLPSFKSCI